MSSSLFRLLKIVLKRCTGSGLWRIECLLEHAMSSLSLFSAFGLSMNPIVHEIAVMYEMADLEKKSDSDHVALISESDLNKITHGSDKKMKSKK
jgi:hypothetical protein